jgi:hypothetical protein
MLPNLFSFFILAAAKDKENENLSTCVLVARQKDTWAGKSGKFGEKKRLKISQPFFCKKVCLLFHNRYFSPHLTLSPLGSRH